MVTRDNVIIVVVCMILNSNKNKKSKRKYWVCLSLLNYNSSNLLEDLGCNDSNANFEFLINLVDHKVCKQYTNFRDSIPLKK
jgi:hypothetical protein